MPNSSITVLWINISTSIYHYIKTSFLSALSWLAPPNIASINGVNREISPPCDCWLYAWAKELLLLLRKFVSATLVYSVSASLIDLVLSHDSTVKCSYFGYRHPQSFKLIGAFFISKKPVHFVNRLHICSNLSNCVE